MNLVATGLNRAFRGLRTGDQRVLLLGAALLAVGLLRRGRKDRRLVYRRVVPEGQSLVIRTKVIGEPPLEVTTG